MLLRTTRTLKSLTRSTKPASPCVCWNPAPRSAFSTSRPIPSMADGFVNMINTDTVRPNIVVSHLTPLAGIVLIDGLVLPSPAIFVNGAAFMWDVDAPNDMDMSWEGWSEEKLRIFEIVTPRPEILLVGTGKRGLFPPPYFKKYLNGLGIQVDVLDSKNACSTYNLLAEEGRRVAAAIYPIAPLDARTGATPCTTTSDP